MNIQLLSSRQPGIELNSEIVGNPMTSIACTAEATVSPDEVVPCCSTAEKRMLGFSTLAIYAVALAIILYNFM